MTKRFLYLVILFTAGISIIPISSADSPPPIPDTFSGIVRFVNSSGEFNAPAGTLIEALIDNITKGSTIVETSGGYMIDVRGTSDDDGKTITFRINGSTALQNATFNTNSPPPRILMLTNTAIKVLPSVRYINGTVMDSVTKAVLSGVTVSTNTSLSTTTDATGFYSLAVTEGSYGLTAKLNPAYYTNSSVTVSTVGSAVVVQDIELIKKPTGTITGTVTS